MSNFTYGSQANVSAMELAFSIYTDVDDAFFDVEYPEHDWYKVLKQEQILEKINPGATSYAARTRDRQGTAAFVGKNQNNNIPKVSQSIGAFEVPMAASAVGATLNNEDARQYNFGFNSDLAQDLGETMRTACDNLIEQTVFFGDASVPFFSTFICILRAPLRTILPSNLISPYSKYRSLSISFSLSCIRASSESKSTIDGRLDSEE